MKSLLIIALLMTSASLFAQKRKSKTTYKYKKYEKLYLDELSTTVGDGGLSDLTLDTGISQKFKNALPSREHFKPEVRRSIRRIK